MIRINLIPVPKVRKQEKLIIESAIGLVAIVLVVAIGIIVSGQKQEKVNELNEANSKIEREIQKLKAKVGEVEKYKNKLKVLEDQLAVINRLQAGRSGPVRLMDELTDLVPRKLWLTSYTEKNLVVTINGAATDGPVVADFLDNLKKAKFFSGAELVKVNQADENGQAIHRFTITVNVKYDI